MNDEDFLAHMLDCAAHSMIVEGAQVDRLRRLANWADAPTPPCWTGLLDAGEVKRAVEAARQISSSTT